MDNVLIRPLREIGDWLILSVEYSTGKRDYWIVNLNDYLNCAAAINSLCGI